MKIRTQSLFQQLATSAKTFFRGLGRIMAPAPREIPANCVNINALLMHLCDFDQRDYRYIIKWLAYPLQFPGAKMQYALMVNGPDATGHDLFFNYVVAAIYGRSARRMNSMLIESPFNGWASGARIVIGEGRLARTVTLKSLMTSESVTIHRIGQEEEVEENRMNFVFLSHSSDFLPLTANDRRFMIVEAPPAREPLFYKAVREEIKHGGIEAFRRYLVSGVDLGDFNQFDEPPRGRLQAHREVA